MATKKSLKVVLIGDSCTGKTSFVHRFLVGKCPEKHVPTIGVEVHSIKFEHVEITFWDTAGEGFGGLRDGYYIGADAAICFADASSPDPLRSFQKWEADFTHSVPGVPVIRVLNKADLIPGGKSEFSSDDYFLISSKESTNLREPLDALLEMLIPKEK